MNFNILTHSWIIQVFVVVLLTLVTSYMVQRIYRQLHPRLRKTKNLWDDTLVHAVYKPARYLIWVWGLAFAAQIAASQGGGTVLAPHIVLFKAIGPLRNVLTIVLLVWSIIRFISGVEAHYLEGVKKKDVNKTTVHAVCQLLRISVLITAALITLQTFGIPITGIWAFGGVGGLGVALAAKDLLGNFFGGLMIFLDRPFEVGDWVRAAEKDIEGTVEAIGWRLTRIRTFDKRPLYVPNGLFSTMVLENPSRMTNRRIKANIGLRYQDAQKVAGIMQAVKAMLQNHPEIDTEKTLIVNLVSFDSSSLTFMVYTFTKTIRWVRFQEVQQDVFLKILDIIKDHGAECAFPTTTLHVPEGLTLNKKEEKNDTARAYS